MSDITFGPFVLNPVYRTLTRDGEAVAVTAKVLDTLIVLVQNRGRVTTKDELLAALWPDTTVEEANLTQNISTLRRILGDNPKNQRYIATITGRGYAFVAPIIEASGTLMQDNPDLGRQLRKRTGRWVTVAVLVAATAASAGYFLSKVTDRTGTAPELRIVPFTADPGVETMPAFSPDGKQIVFVRTEYDPSPWRGFWKEFLGATNLYLKVVEAGSELRLTTGSASDSFPAWSPDGQHIAFFRRTSDGDLGYYVVSAVGGPERRIAAAANASGGLTWFPDGKHLVISEVSANSESSPLVAISTGTGDRHVLTSPSKAMDLFPEFSPDGKWLAFVRGVDFSNADVYLTHTEGGPVRQLTFDGAFKHSIAWTPDSGEIVYSSEGLWRIPIRGGLPRAITPGDQVIGKIAIARRGQRLAVRVSQRERKSSSYRAFTFRIAEACYLH